MLKKEYFQNFLNVSFENFCLLKKNFLFFFILKPKLDNYSYLTEKIVSFYSVLIFFYPFFFLVIICQEEKRMKKCIRKNCNKKKFKFILTNFKLFTYYSNKFKRLYYTI